MGSENANAKIIGFYSFVNSSFQNFSAAEWFQTHSQANILAAAALYFKW